TRTEQKLRIVDPYRLDEKKRTKLVSTGRTFIAVDSLGAGEGQFVLVTQGSSARMTPETKTLPIDAVIIGLVDTVQVEGKEVFNRDTADNQAD
ncbi:MAG: ethanolamine utilization protein EutN, partial [Pirellulales bacterium]|nr:ethanolamine utilization protein EutN [Pirellulales bacterium]